MSRKPFNKPRTTRATDSWRKLELGYARQDIQRVRDMAVFAVTLRDTFEREFGRDGELLAQIFCEVSRQLELQEISVDIQGLANGLGWPYATAHWRCLQLEKKGHLVLRKAGRHIAISWSDETLERIMEALKVLDDPPQNP